MTNSSENRTYILARIIRSISQPSADTDVEPESLMSIDMTLLITS